MNILIKIYCWLYPLKHSENHEYNKAKRIRVRLRKVFDKYPTLFVEQINHPTISREDHNHPYQLYGRLIQDVERCINNHR